MIGIANEKDILEVVKELANLSYQLDDLEEKSKVVKAKIAAHKNKIKEVYELNGIKSAVFDGIGRVTIHERVFGQIKDRELAIKSLRELGYGDYVFEEISKSDVNTIVKECLSEGNNIPEGIVYSVVRDPRLHRM